jgi:hypothetical protein
MTAIHDEGEAEGRGCRRSEERAATAGRQGRGLVVARGSGEEEGKGRKPLQRWDAWEEEVLSPAVGT